MKSNFRNEYMRRPANKYILFALLIVVFLITFPESRDLVKLEINRAKWRIQHITHYRYQLEVISHFSYMGVTPITIEVQDGKIISYVDAHGTLLAWERGDSKIFGEDQTIEGLFEHIQREILKEGTVYPEYNWRYGYPIFILFDPAPHTTHSGQIYQISNFEILP